MTTADGRAFLERLAGLSELFAARLSPAVQQIYFEALRDLPLAPVLTAMSALVQTARFMPKPAEIRQFVVGDDEDHAEQAWVAWRAAAQRVGAYSSVLVADAALAETLGLVFGGWREACRLELSPEMWAAKRKEFGRVYRVVTARRPTGPRYLAGVVELENAAWPWRSHPLAVLEDGRVWAVPTGEVDAVKALAATRPRLEDACGPGTRQLTTSSAAACTPIEP